MKLTGKCLFFIPLLTIVVAFTICSVRGTSVFANGYESYEGVDVGQKAILFELPTVDGKMLDLKSFRKDKVLLLVFSATWCRACVHEIPTLNEYSDLYKDSGLEIVSIDIKESRKRVKSFVKKKEINYTVLLDEDAEVAIMYKVTGIPLNVIVDKNGVIRYKEHRPPSKFILEKLLYPKKSTY